MRVPAVALVVSLQRPADRRWLHVKVPLAVLMRQLTVRVESAIRALLARDAALPRRTARWVTRVAPVGTRPVTRVTAPAAPGITVTRNVDVGTAGGPGAGDGVGAVPPEPDAAAEAEGVTAFDAADAGEVPAALLAVAVKV